MQFSRWTFAVTQTESESQPREDGETNLSCFGLLFCIQIPIRELPIVHDAILDHSYAGKKDHA